MKPIGKNRARLTGAVLVLCALPMGCDSDEPPAMEMLQVSALTLQKLDWSSDPIASGKVAAVADTTDDVALYSDAGVYVYSSGALLGNDSSVQTWRDAATVPALGLAGSWLLGVGGDGLLYRLRNRTTLDDVTMLYGVDGQPVHKVAAMGGALVALQLDDQLAIVDGQNVNRYSLNGQGLAGGGGRVAVYSEVEVTVLDPPSGALHRYPATGVVSIAFAPDGKLWAATATSLYVERDAGLLKLFDTTPPETIASLSATPSGVWVAIGDTLAIVRDSALLRGQPGLLPASGRISGSTSGDVWVLSDKVERLGEATGSGADQTYWRQSLLPIFNRLCQGCHLPNGSAHIDLSTYSSWATRRALIGQRVIDQQPSPMPPQGAGTLLVDELAALRTWVGRTAP